MLQKKSKRKKTKKNQVKEEKLESTRKNLIHMRVIQRNLVYITNLALSVADEEVGFWNNE